MKKAIGKSTPRRILAETNYEAFYTAPLYNDMVHRRAPGWWIKQLSKDKRDILKKLKSGDISNDGLPRPDWM